MNMKKISLSKIDEIVKAYSNNEKRIVNAKTEKGDIEIEVLYEIPLSAQEDIVEYVANTVCSIDENGEMKYRPLLYHTVLAAAILLNYTNLKIEGSIERIAAFKDTAVYRDILESISATQFYLIEDAIDAKIKYLIKDRQKQIEVLLRKIDDFIKPLSDFVESDGGEQLNKAIKNLANIDEKTIIDTVAPKEEGEQ